MRLRRPLRDVPLFFSALVCVAIVRIALSTRKTHIIKRRIRTDLERGLSLQQASKGNLAEVAWSVTAASRFIPGATCLTQAYAGAWLLARKGQPSELEITLPVSGADSFRPHAWLFQGTVIVLGGTPEDYSQHRPFTANATRA